MKKKKKKMKKEKKSGKCKWGKVAEKFNGENITSVFLQQPKIKRQDFLFWNFAWIQEIL